MANSRSVLYQKFLEKATWNGIPEGATKGYEICRKVIQRGHTYELIGVFYENSSNPKQMLMSVETNTLNKGISFYRELKSNRWLLLNKPTQTQAAI